MHPDAGDQSLSGTAPPRELLELLTRVENTEAVNGHVLQQLQEILTALERSKREMAAVMTAQAVLRGEPSPTVAAGARHAGKAKPRTPPGKRWLHAVPGVAAAGVAARWVLQSRAHKIAAGTLAATVAAGGTAVAPSLILGSPPPSPAAVRPAQHHHYRPPASAVPSPSPVPPLAAPARHHHGTSPAAAPRPSPAPSATATVSPPAPVPSATATGTPAVPPSTEPADPGDGDPGPGGKGGGHGRGLLATVLDVLPLW